MTSIGGLSSTSSSTISGYGGLASGLDRDSLIEGMTAGTQLKIDNANRELQTLKWEQEAYQSISNEIYNFTQKFTSYSSSSNLLSSSLYAMNSLEAIGEFSKYVSVSGASETMTPVEILGVKSLAQNEMATSAARVTSGLITSKALSDSMASEANVSSVVGDTITFKYGEDTYTLTIENEDNLPLSEIDSAEEIAALISKSAENVELKNGQTLADVIEFSANGEKLVMKNIDSTGGGVWISGGTGDVLVDLGILADGETISSLGEDGNKITTAGITAKADADLVKEQTLADAFSEANIKFEYNGNKYEITLGTISQDSTLTHLKDEIQKQINNELGSGRVNVSITDAGELSFATITPNGEADPTSSLTLTGSTNNLLGENGILGMETGVSNRLALTKTLAESGIAGASIDTSAEMTIKNADGELINLEDYGLTWDSTVSEIMNTLNDIDELGVTVSYQEETDKFSIVSKYDGAAGNIELSGTLYDAMFAPSGLNVQEGQDAVIALKYASGEVVEVTRGTNTINSNGMEITVSGEFGYAEVVNEEGITVLALDTTQEAVTFDVGIDTEETAELVKEFIDEYNEILANVYTAARERPDSDYYALTTDEKNEMSEGEIELWEEEAKKGLLYGDSILNSLADDLRFMISPEFRDEFEAIGITVSTNYADNGKLVFDQAAFESALKEDPENVKELLSGEAASSTVGTDGLVAKVKDTMDKYASMTGATKGLLVEKAGSEYAPTSVLSNTMLDMIEDMEEKIESLKDTLQIETDRYTTQFTALETLISEMNSQSSYLSSMEF